MTRPKKGTEEKFISMLKKMEPAMKERITHHKNNFSSCTKYKQGHSVSKFWDLVNCNECLKIKEIKP